MNDIVEIHWGSLAQHYILGEYPSGIEKKTRPEIQARIDFAIKQAEKWLGEAYQVAEDGKGEGKFAFGMQQAKVWQQQAKVLREVLA